MQLAQVARISVASGIVVALAAACASFSARADAPGDDGGGADGEAGAPPPPAVDSCDLPDAAAPLPTSCGEIASSDSNCGACGHACLTSTPCESGRCAPEHVDSESASSVLALLDGSLYLTSAGNVISRRRADGTGTRQMLASYPPDAGYQITAFSANENGIVVAAYTQSVDLLDLDGQLVARAPYPTEVASASAAPGAFYFSGPSSAHVDYAARDGGLAAKTQTFFDEGPGRVAAVTVQGADLLIALDNDYGTVDGGDGGDGRIVLKTLEGGNTTHSAPLGSPRDIAFYRDSIYWFDGYDRAIHAAPRASLGSPSQVVASLANVPGLPSFAVFGAGMVVDDASVYVWLVVSGGDSYLVHASRCGHGNVAPRVIAHVYAAYGLVADAAYLYWADQTGLMRMAK